MLGKLQKDFYSGRAVQFVGDVALRSCNIGTPHTLASAMLLRTPVSQLCPCTAGLNAQGKHHSQSRRLEVVQPRRPLEIRVILTGEQPLGLSSRQAVAWTNRRTPHTRSLIVRTSATVMGGAVEVGSTYIPPDRLLFLVCDLTIPKCFANQYKKLDLSYQ